MAFLVLTLRAMRQAKRRPARLRAPLRQSANSIFSARTPVAPGSVAIEVKRRRGGDKQLRAWMPPQGLVVTDEPRCEPIVHLAISTFIELAGGGDD